MYQLKLFSIFIVLLLSTSAVWATKIHECEDEQGNRSFQKHCPPGSKSVSEKQYSGRTGAADAGQALPTLVLYAVPNCEVCDQVRKHLSVRNIPVTEKNIKDNGLLQQELKSKTGGDLRVPVLLIGDKVLSGYDHTNLTNALTAAGYKAEDTEKE
jgi:glutaredoxin